MARGPDVVVSRVPAGCSPTERPRMTPKQDCAAEPLNAHGEGARIRSFNVQSSTFRIMQAQKLVIGAPFFVFSSVER